MAIFKYGRGVYSLTNYYLSSQRYLHKTVMTFQRFEAENRNKKILGWEGSPNKLEEVQLEGEEFRVLVIPGHTKLHSEKDRFSKKNRERLPPRYKIMQPDQDWTKVWPTATTFKWSVVPFPVRQGVPLGKETGGMPNEKFANTELIKIPNFLHLTPPHVKKYCKALKEFCTPWPENLKTDEDLETHFPVEIVTRKYVRDAPTHQDPRGRIVSLKIKLSTLKLDYHAKDKLLRLVGDRYDPETDILTLTSDRCPVRKQNYDYTHYLLTALYHESWKTEPWESEKQLADMETYIWDINPSRKSVVELVRNIIKYKNEADSSPDTSPVEGLPQPAALAGHTTAGEGYVVSEDRIVEMDSIQQIKHATETLRNEGENVLNLEQYKLAVRKLLIGDPS